MVKIRLEGLPVEVGQIVGSLEKVGRVLYVSTEYPKDSENIRVFVVIAP